MSMINLSHSNAIFTGGSYTQVNHNIQQKKSSWDLLQSATAPSAFHDAGDTFDAPRCHPNTRVAIMNELRDFALRRGDTGRAKILWLNGGAGAGKSAIARSLCEEFSAANSLLASFFFNRSDAYRNNHKSFVATITYQIYGIIPQHYQSLILGVIDRDPLVLTRSIDAQVAALIAGPLHDLFVNGYFNDIGKWLIVVDGLDECSPTAAQVNILAAIRQISAQANIPFIFVIASRPENALQSFFRSPSMVPLLHRLSLNDSYKPDKDIERFLRDKLREVCETHPFRDSIPSEWPLDESIRILVRKSSGQFIYASLVVKYITTDRHHPPKRLEVILKLRSAKGDLPFAELDALYMHILSSAEGDIDLALRLIRYWSVGKVFTTIEDLAPISQSDPDDCLTAFCDLWSVLTLEATPQGHRIRISHKSFLDFLQDNTRSAQYHISNAQVRSELMGKCFLYISEVTWTPESFVRRRHVINFFRGFGYRLINNIPLAHHDLMSFSLVNCYSTFAGPSSRSALEASMLKKIVWDNFFFELLERLRTLVGTDYAYLYDHHLGELRTLIIRHPDVYGPSMIREGRKGSVNLTRADTMITGLILTGQFGSEAPLKNLASGSSDLVSGKYSDLKRGFMSAHSSDGGQESLLIHDAVLQCFKFLEYDVNPSSVAATLRYLTWALGYASYSSELYSACSTSALPEICRSSAAVEFWCYSGTPSPVVMRTRKSLSHPTKGNYATALSNVVDDVTTAMQYYSERWAKIHHHTADVNNHNSNIDASGSGLIDDGDEH